MALNFGDRLRTIVVTATVTSAAWIVAGGLGFAPRVEPFAGTTGAAVPSPAPSASTTVAPAVVSVAANPGGLTIPVVGIKPDQLTDTFSQARAGGARVHDAIDIIAPAGTPVVAAAPGTVEKLFNSKDGGITIYVRSPDKRAIHYYAHLLAYAPGLHEGQILRQGEVLGQVGSTGNASASGPHLHFAIMQTTPTAKWWDAATAVNPYPLLTNHTDATKR